MFQLRSIRIGLPLALAVLVVHWTASVPRAQGGGITFDNFNASPWPAGPDYATDVLGDPWDFSNIEDLDPAPYVLQGWSSFSLNGGLAGGTTSSSVSSMGILNSSFTNVLSPGRNGRRFPIDSSRYQKFGLRLTSSVAAGAPQIYWFHDPCCNPGGDSGHGVQQFSSFTAGGQIYSTDLTAYTTDGRPWIDGVVRGMRFDRNGSSQSAALYYDWVRLTVKDSDPAAAMQTIRWTFGSGPATVRVIDVNNTSLTIGSVGDSVTSLAWNYGVLPPGSYTLQVSRGDQTQSRPFTINDPPMIELTEPNETGGEDYATKVLGNAWDMDAPGDVQITGTEFITPPVYSGGVMTSQNLDGYAADFFLLANSNNGVPIDTSRYRYFTIRYQVDGAFDLGLGSVARILWSSASAFGGTTATTTKAFVVWPGMNTYTIDLSTLKIGQEDGLETSGDPQEWMAGSKRFLNFHPHEFQDTGRPFHVDYVKLAAMAETVNGAFTLKWSGSDANGGDPAVALYYDTDTSPANGMTPIVSNLSMSAGQYFWNTSSVPAGVYWIYVAASDGVQTHGRYATGQLRVVAPGPVSNPLMVVDTPADPSVVVQPFPISGWAIDLGAPAGTGIDAVHVWAFPTSGASPTFVGAADLFRRRDDLVPYFGSQFTNAGYSMSASGLPPGGYQLQVFGRSTVTGTFDTARVIGITIPTSAPAMALDAPSPGASVTATFTVSGWALDQHAPPANGSGVDYLDGWAWPLHDDGTLGTPINLGRVSSRTSRSDIAAIFGGQFLDCGFSFSVSILPPGRYRIVVFAHSVVAGTFNSARSVDVRVGASATDPLLVIDTPAWGATVSSTFPISGWAVDRGAPTGTGVTTVHVWAYPASGAPPFLIGGAAYGASRPDVAAVLGDSRFTNSGYSLSADLTSKPAGVYDIVAFMYSTVTGSFSFSRVARVTMQ